MNHPPQSRRRYVCNFRQTYLRERNENQATGWRWWLEYGGVLHACPNLTQTLVLTYNVLYH